VCIRAAPAGDTRGSPGGDARGREARDDIDLEERTVRIDEKVVEVRGRFEWGTQMKDSARIVHLPEVAVKPLAGHLLRFPRLRAATDRRWEGLDFYGARGGPDRRHVFRRFGIGRADWLGSRASGPSGSVNWREPRLRVLEERRRQPARAYEHSADGHGLRGGVLRGLEAGGRCD
jgi:hypothetical protein